MILRDAAYISPSGVRVPFLYEDVSMEFDKKATRFEFQGSTNTLVQEHGHTMRRFPLEVIFSGQDYDVQAEEFLLALQERGVGILEHPVYGTANVVVMDTVTRKDSLVTAGNQVIVSLTFHETILDVYPFEQVDPASLIGEQLDLYATEAAMAFADSVVIDPPEKKIGLREQYKQMLKDVRSGLQNVSDKVAAVQQVFESVYNDIQGGIDTLVGQPIALALQTIALIQYPARAVSNITASLDAYANLLNSIVTKGNASADLQASACVSGAVVSVVAFEFSTKTETLQAAERVRGMFTKYVELTDVGQSYESLQELVALVEAYLVYISFQLKQEHAVTLDRNRNVIELCYELYGNVDQLDFLISSNSLTGDQILELPCGLTVRYYV